MRAIRSGGVCAVPFSIADEQATDPFLRATAPVARRAAALMPGVYPGDPLAVFTALRGAEGPAEDRGVCLGSYRVACHERTSRRRIRHSVRVTVDENFQSWFGVFGLDRSRCPR